MRQLGFGQMAGARVVVGLAVLMGMGLAGPTARAGTIFVAKTGADGNDGLTWATAKGTVAGGLAVAVEGDQVWVAKGVYFGYVPLKNGVGLYGGFAGSESRLEERNWVTNVTVLTGEEDGHLVGGLNDQLVYILGATASSTRIDGFKICHGGTGIYCRGGTPTICNNFITENGPVIPARSATLHDGAGISCGGTASPIIINNIIAHNIGILGGGIYCNGGSPQILNNVITSNVARLGQRSTGGGGGIYCTNTGGTLAGNVITGNSVLASGSYGVGAGGGVFCEGTKAPTVSNNTIVGNMSYTAGGVYTIAPMTLVNNIVAFNSSGIYGGTQTSLLNNCVYNPDGANYTNVSAGSGDVSVDPQIVAVEYGQVHLRAGSPCIDAGLDSAVQDGWRDMDGEARAQGTHVDIGADEFNGVSAPPFAPTIVRVSTTGNDANDGSSWALAKATIQAGIDAAVMQGGEVWVAAGTYNEYLVLWAWASIYGGFAGTETSREERDWNAHETVLDGPLPPKITTFSARVTALCGFRFGRIDGLRMQQVLGDYAGQGHGIHCWASPTVANNRFSHNWGAGVYCDRSAPVIANNWFSNQSDHGIYCSGASPKIVNNRIEASTRCGVYCYAGSFPMIANNRITGNAQSGVHCLYGASPSLVNNTIVGNGGADYKWTQITYAGVYCDADSAPVIANCIIAFNYLGIWNGRTSALTVRNSCFYNPSGDYHGSITGTGYIIVDPLLVAAGSGEVHLAAGSPCMDAGLDSVVDAGWVDMDGEARVQGAHVDIGADEFNGVAPTHTPAVVRVSPTGDDANDGSSWTAAKRTVQAGIDAAAEKGGEVWVGEGSYQEAVRLGAWVSLYGGFAGTEASRGQRNWASHKTILNGLGSAAVITLYSGYRANEISGFTIRNGRSGGIDCYGSSPVISNNLIMGNSRSGYGAGIGQGVAPLIVNNTIYGNTARGTNATGGGIECWHGAEITNNTIVGNSAGAGAGGIYGCCSIINNIVAFNSSGIGQSGQGTPILYNNCVFNPGATNYIGVSPGTGDISVDPKLVAASYGEVHLAAASPCINAGRAAAVQANWLDGDAQPRVQGIRVDIGADEFSGTSPTYAPSVIRVSLAGDDAHDGSSWAAAKATVQAGLDAAECVGGEVWVAAGVYRERIDLKPAAYLYGGFAGTEDGRDQRDWRTHVTTLDGSRGGSVVNVLSGHLLACIDGFTIRNGLTDPGSPTGGGVLCSAAALIVHNIITENTVPKGVTYTGAGGGIYCYAASPVIADNVITGNANGGITLIGDAAPLIVNNTIVNNAASGIDCGSSSSPTIVNNILAFNLSGIEAQGATPSLSHNCVHNPDGTDYVGMAAGPGDISTDPQLVGVEYGQYHLAATSPCVDAGNDGVGQPDAKAVDGQLRWVGVHVDMGADELVGAPPPYTPAIVRVSTWGADVGDGATWASAKRTVQAGIDAAATTGGDVWVAAGEYVENIRLRPGVYVYGGFAGTENGREQRNWATNLSILDGGANGSVVTTILGYRFGRVDGFTVRNGSGTKLSGSNEISMDHRCGGGIYCDGASPTIANNVITGNSVQGASSSDRFAYGGGIYCGTPAAPWISNNIIVGNRCTGSGGGIYSEHPGVKVLGNVIGGNTADWGGGLDTKGGLVVNNLFVGNSAPSSGGGMVDVSTNALVVANCVFSGNTASTEGAAIVGRSGSQSWSNCIFWGNSSAPIATARSSAPTVTYSDVEGGYAGTGNINSEPLFVRAPSAGGDGVWGTEDDDYGDLRLMAGSPCIDAGSNAAVPAGILTDLAGVSRFLDDPATADCQWAAGTCGAAPIVDMGAYEFMAGDYDRDGDVDREDVAAFVACVSGPSVVYIGDCAAADFDHDGDVDLVDFGALQRCFCGGRR